MSASASAMIAAARTATPNRDGGVMRKPFRRGNCLPRHRQPADDEQRHAKHQREPRQRKQRDDDLYDDRHAADEAPLALELRMLAHGPGAAVVLGFEWLKLDAGEGREFLRGHGAWSIGGCAASHFTRSARALNTVSTSIEFAATARAALIRSASSMM